jgi:hypothetical protein
MTCRRRKKKCDESRPECKLFTAVVDNPFVRSKLIQQVTIVFEEALYALATHNVDSG